MFHFSGISKTGNLKVHKISLSSNLLSIFFLRIFYRKQEISLLTTTIRYVFPIRWLAAALRCFSDFLYFLHVSSPCTKFIVMETLLNDSLVFECHHLVSYHYKTDKFILFSDIVLNTPHKSNDFWCQLQLRSVSGPSLHCLKSLIVCIPTSPKWKKGGLKLLSNL